jgi:hypothetical protein
MKTRIATTAVLLALIISTTAFSSEPVPVPASKAVASSVATLIENNLDYPEFAIEEKFEGDVALELYIEDDGTLDVVKANSVNAEMKEYVIESVENIETNQFAKYSGQTVLVKVSYDLKLY